MEAQLLDGKKGIALYSSLNTDRHYISLLSSDDVPNNWIVLGILCEERPEEEVGEIFRSLKQPITYRVTI